MRQSKEFRDNFVFFVYQLEREAVKSELLLKEFALEKTPETREAFLGQFDILWSRVASLETGSLGTEFLLLENSRSSIPKLQSGLETIDAYIIANEYTDQSLGKMADELTAMAELGRELSLSALFVHQEQSRLRRENLANIYVAAIALFSLALILGVMLSIYLLMQNRRLIHLGKTLEKKVHDRTRDLQQNNQQLRQEIEERKRVMKELKLSQNVAERANRAKTQFLANMSHELRTPLNAIIGFAEVMKKEIWGPINEPKYQGYVNDIHSSGRHLSDLLKEILDLTKIEAGEVKVVREVTPLDDLLKDVERLSRILCERNQSELVFEKDQKLNLNVDATMIKQILLNFVSNAFKHAGRGCRVEIRYELEKDFKLIISDNGKGIAKEDCDVILEPFKQARNAVSIASSLDSASGTGIGLSISIRLAELHGGTIKIQSELGKGTEAILILPLTSVAD
ncbi:sensor histidine kinase [Curvivirga aplysinae]|uniref:sensor histidine kinase n=1 Tax=Curvivirga aplysinae TaxID=2529852 RepID=UPI001C3F8ABE|nr:HAMP domain-containing sensor histidine kinase [Curvivirga aplysinae]